MFYKWKNVSLASHLLLETDLSYPPGHQQFMTGYHWQDMVLINFMSVLVSDDEYNEEEFVILNKNSEQVIFYHMRAKRSLQFTL